MSSRESTSISLPVELYHHILSYFNEFDFQTRQATLVALSSSSKTLRRIAQPYLYTHPRDLDTAERQWKFQLALLAEPHRAILVQSLQLLWLAEGVNSGLLIDIVRSSPHLKSMLLERGEKYRDSNRITLQDVEDLASLLDACSELISFRYTTMLAWTFEDAMHEGDDAINGEVRTARLAQRLNDTRFVSAARRLTELSLHNQAEWIAQALLPFTSSRLQSLCLGPDLSLAFDRNLLCNLAGHSPFLESLRIRSSVRIHDLIQACKAWAPTLRVLQVILVKDDEGLPARITGIFPTMPVLQEFYLGAGCYTTIEAFGAIAQTLAASPIQYFTVRNLQGLVNVDDELAASTQLNNAVCHLVRSCSETLQTLELKRGDSQVGRSVLHACQEARNLVRLLVSPLTDVSPLENVVPSDLDDLLHTCPALSQIPATLLGISSCQELWHERSRSLEKQEEENRKKDQGNWGLGCYSRWSNWSNLACMP
ncbi:hypothetical protein NUU61_004739 [Penicillium alfredii]|uniref:F-box domain-containing protein n=1 Tax=Penicillium alfredii TaxID=1506179 RepID=A0A9W9K6W8_9EURO|nr:uncharacterized protein NUU61_004739 [Penicillium alfredii]KAJ5095383.1 hypothetical protein NUU61_004739 [Penicillium alfredii]